MALERNDDSTDQYVLQFCSISFESPAFRVQFFNWHTKLIKQTTSRLEDLFKFDYGF